MFRLFHGVTRKEGVSEVEFRAFWDGPELRGLITEGMQLLGADRFQKNLVLNVELNQKIKDARGSQQPYSGTIEYWFENASRMPDLEGAIFQNWVSRIEALQAKYIDFGQSAMFITDWE